MNEPNTQEKMESAPPAAPSPKEVAMELVAALRNKPEVKEPKDGN